MGNLENAFLVMLAGTGKQDITEFLHRRTLSLLTLKHRFNLQKEREQETNKQTGTNPERTIIDAGSLEGGKQICSGYTT